MEEEAGRQGTADRTFVDIADAQHTCVDLAGFAHDNR